MRRCAVGGTIQGKISQDQAGVTRLAYKRMGARQQHVRERFDVDIAELREELRQTQERMREHETTCERCREVRKITEEIRNDVLARAGVEIKSVKQRSAEA